MAPLADTAMGFSWFLAACVPEPGQCKQCRTAQPEPIQPSRRVSKGSDRPSEAESEKSAFRRSKEFPPKSALKGSPAERDSPKGGASQSDGDSDQAGRRASKPEPEPSGRRPSGPPVAGGPGRAPSKGPAGKAGRLADDQILMVRFRQVMKSSFKSPKVAFDMLDVNGDDLISKEEWMATLLTVGKAAAWDEDTVKMMTIWGEQIFEEMDTNHKGTLTFKKFKDTLAKKLDPCQGLQNLAHFKASIQQSFANPKDAFRMLDKNGDGTVTKEEWEVMLAAVGRSVKWDEHTMALMDVHGSAFFDQLDTNLDGELSFKEFKYNLKTPLQ